MKIIIHLVGRGRGIDRIEHFNDINDIIDLT